MAQAITPVLLRTWNFGLSVQQNNCCLTSFTILDEPDSSMSSNC